MKGEWVLWILARLLGCILFVLTVPVAVLFMLMGAIFCCTLIGMVIGIPLIAFGFGLIGESLVFALGPTAAAFFDLKRRRRN